MAPRFTSDQRELARSLTRFVEPDTRTGTILLLADYAVFLLGMVLAASGGPLWVRLLGSGLAGLKLCGFSVLGHDAAHNTLTRSRRLNRVYAVLAFTPCLFNYRLWLHAHHALHHSLTNGAPPDIHKPFTWAQYKGMPAWRRLWVRATRSPNPIAQGLYFICDRLSRVTVLSPLYPAPVRRQAIPYTLLTLTYLITLLTALAARNDFAAGRSLADIGLVVLLPLFIFHSLTSFVLFMQHTHPRIPWFSANDPLEKNYGQEQLVAHVRMPAWAGSLMHYSLEHPAHHVVPALPCYRAREAQAHLNELIGSRAVIVQPSLAAIGDVFRRCKLYDYESHRWMDFNGNYSTEAEPGPQQTVAEAAR